MDDEENPLYDFSPLRKIQQISPKDEKVEETLAAAPWSVDASQNPLDLAHIG